MPAKKKSAQEIIMAGDKAAGPAFNRFAERIGKVALSNKLDNSAELARAAWTVVLASHANIVRAIRDGTLTNADRAHFTGAAKHYDASLALLVRPYRP